MTEYLLGKLAIVVFIYLLINLMWSFWGAWSVLLLCKMQLAVCD